ncbi:MAG: hypothetical protein M1839_006473 [Geoglossum umbratile]|nr:MAG: hypothetical protein M1839_006473 [Geoglossum umbratile]
MAEGDPVIQVEAHYLRPKEPIILTHLHRTHVADVDFDPVSGRKLLNQYEIVDEIGRGVHGKVKLGRNLETNDLVAIKIVDRYPKRRRLGKSHTPEDKVKKEVAILKKCRHPNVVSLLEVVDDPAKKKVYIVLEYVALGEIIWRKKGDKDIVAMERRRQGYESRGLTEQEMRAEEARFLRDAGRRRERRERRRARQQSHSSTGPDFWSLEHGGESEDDDQVDAITNTIEEGIATTDFARHTESRLVSAPTSRATSSRGSTPLPLELDIPPLDSDNEGDEPTTMHPNRPNHLQRELDGTMYGAYVPEYRTRTPSITNSFSSHFSSEDVFDPYEEEHSYVPCLTIAQARQTFRDTVLGLEYLHYQGIVHRDIKPANLLWTSQHRVKISDFGVSYLGRPIRDGNSIDDSETDTETWDEAIELAKTVGTPAFYAPELCYTDFTKPRPSVTGQIDVWALGVTLYCLIFARLPFLAEDEFALFKAIAEDEVFIPRKRLRAANGCRVTPASGLSMASMEPASMDQRYENISDDLYDLLKRLLLKDSRKRITLREVKRHPWVLYGIPDPIGWIQETDPSRQNEGKKIEVSTEDVEKAVVPIGIIERVRSGIRKVGQAILGKGREREGGRHRARSSVHSEETSPAPTAASFSRVNMREERRTSLNGDELIPPLLSLQPPGLQSLDLIESKYQTGTQQEPEATVLELAASVGLATVVSELPKGAPNTDTLDGHAKRAAFRRGFTRAIEFLVCSGVARVDLKGRNGPEVLLSVTTRDWYDAAEIVLREARLAASEDDSTASREWVQLLIAAFYGDDNEVNRLVRDSDLKGQQQGRGFGETALFLTVERNHPRAVQILLDAGVDVNSVDSTGQTALNRATRRGREEIVRQLLCNGAKVDVKDDNGHTAWSANAHLLNERVLGILLAAGANPNTTGHNGISELYSAASRGDDAQVKFLLKSGTNPSIKTRYGWTPLHWAASNDLAIRGNHLDVIDLLQQAGASRAHDTLDEQSVVSMGKGSRFIDALLTNDATKMVLVFDRPMGQSLPFGQFIYPTNAKRTKDLCYQISRPLSTQADSISIQCSEGFATALEYPLAPESSNPNGHRTLYDITNTTTPSGCDEFELRGNGQSTTIPRILKMRNVSLGCWEVKHSGHSNSTETALLQATSPDWQNTQDPGGWRWVSGKERKLLARASSGWPPALCLEDGLEVQMENFLVACWVAKIWSDTMTRQGQDSSIDISWSYAAS